MNNYVIKICPVGLVNKIIVIINYLSAFLFQYIFISITRLKKIQFRPNKTVKTTFTHLKHMLITKYHIPHPFGFSFHIIPNYNFHPFDQLEFITNT